MVRLILFRQEFGAYWRFVSPRHEASSSPHHWSNMSTIPARYSFKKLLFPGRNETYAESPPLLAAGSRLAARAPLPAVWKFFTARLSA
jgi:hypothetical protein